MRKPEIDKVNLKISEYWTTYQILTDKLSTVLRQLALAEAGIYWILLDRWHLLWYLSLGFLFLVFYFLCDAFQYFFASRDYLSLALESEEKVRKDPKITLLDIKKHPRANHKGDILFITKSICILLSSFIILIYLFSLSSFLTKLSKFFKVIFTSC